MIVENTNPYISGIVVNAETLMSGVGYFNYFYGINKDDLGHRWNRLNMIIKILLIVNVGEIY